MRVLCWFVLCLASAAPRSTVQANRKIPRCQETMAGDIRLETAKGNATCGFVSGIVQMCTLERRHHKHSLFLWTNMCDSNWTDKDAQVACRQLGYSDVGAIGFKPNLAVTRFTDTAPECEGSEPNITSCVSRTLDLEPPCESIPGVNCFLNDRAANICSKVPVTNSTPIISTTTSKQEVPSTSVPTEHTAPSTIVHTTSSQSRNTTSENSDQTDFLASTQGIAAVITLSLFSIGLLVVVVVLVLLKWMRCSIEKPKQSRISTRNGQLEDLTSGQRGHRATSESSGSYEDIDNVTCSGNSDVTMVDNSAYVTCTRMRTQHNSAYTTVQPHDVKAEPVHVYEDVSHITDC